MSHETSNSDLAKNSAGLEKNPTKALDLVKTVKLGPVLARKTGSCCTDIKIWQFRDKGINSLLPREQPAQSDCTVNVYVLNRAVTYREMLEEVLEMPGASFEQLVNGIKEKGICLALANVQRMVHWQEGGNDVGLDVDIMSNFAFTEEADGGIGIISVDRYKDDKWSVFLSELKDDTEIKAGCRLLVRVPTD